MASYDTPSVATFGGQYPVRTLDTTLTVPTGETSVLVQSSTKFRGTVEKIEIDPGAALAENATIKGFEANTPLASGTRDQFLNYTVPNPAVEKVIYPAVPLTDNTGTALTWDGTHLIVGKYVVNDYISLELASAVAGNSVRVRVYVRG